MTSEMNQCKSLQLNERLGHFFLLNLPKMGTIWITNISNSGGRKWRYIFDHPGWVQKQWQKQREITEISTFDLEDYVHTTHRGWELSVVYYLVRDCLNLNVWGQSYIGLTRSISWLLMPWLLTSQRHQQAWYWLYIYIYILFEEGFEVPVSYQCGAMTQNVNTCLCSLCKI